MSETATAFDISWLLVRQVVGGAISDCRTWTSSHLGCWALMSFGTGPCYRTPDNYKSRILLRSAAWMAALAITSADHSRGLEEPG